jgi:AcrR family transcriptional regulator
VLFETVARSAQKSTVVLDVGVTKHESPDVRRAQILAALARVIARDGVLAVSVRSVAAEAGLSAGALRHHFPTQESLLGATAAAGLQATLLRPADAPGADPEVRLGAAVEQFLPLGAAGLDAQRVLVGLVAVSSALPAVGVTVAELSARAREQVRGWFDGDAAADRADEVLAVVDGLALQLLVGSVTPERARALVARRCREWAADLAPG